MQTAHVRCTPRKGRHAYARLLPTLHAAVWAAPLLLYAADAYAWGLYTHMYFAQLLLWAVPLADPRFRRALRRFPELCLAATCVPDVSLFSRTRRAATLGKTHQWSAAARMIGLASSDEERAMALGYASHLLTDIVAHNYFVPEHEHIWLRVPMLTHATAEWAMDAHIANTLFVHPASLIARHRDVLVAWAVRHLGFERALAHRALGSLMHGERALRRSHLPTLIYQVGRRADPGLPERFDHYIRETSRRLVQINRLVAGDTPVWAPEIRRSPQVQPSPMQPAPGPHLSLLLPADFFRDVTAR
ncbi:MAG: hypothetical protein V7640_2008 [Betaproteobacteria bacterium]